MKNWLLIAAAAGVAAGAFGCSQLDAYAGLVAAYKAKIACSEIFLADRDEARVLAEDFRDITPALEYARLKIDAQRRTVATSIFGFGGAKAVYREGYGCTLARGTPADLPPRAPIADKPLPEALAGTPFAKNDVDYAAIEAAIDASFADAKAATRAILVVKDGAVIAERYADGFSAETPLLSWSMAKSVTATMVGAAARQGLLDIDDKVPVAEWANEARRSAITWNHLLQMQSGLAFREVYEDPTSDAVRMLFRARDAGLVAAKKPLAHEPGAFWSYSSGTTNLLQRALRETLEAKGVDYHAFAHASIFAPIGAPSFVLEADSSGTFIGSSFMYATARDWAKLGLLYLNDGVADGVRVLAEGWRDYAVAPASASDGLYGAQFWLNHPGKNGRERYIPGLPDDAYVMAGHEGQFVVIVPDRNLVIVRAGMTRGVEPMTLVAPTLAAIYAAVGP